MTKTVFLTIAGRTNAGKSSLLNTVVGEKIASVSSKSQTTRTRITGIKTIGETQLVFMDTPGLHKPKNKLSAHMLNAVKESVTDIDAVIFMADCTHPLGEQEDDMITDQPEKIIAGEIIREKLLNLLEDEVPHGIAVTVEQMREREEKELLDINAVIYCERESHKGIIIGKNGSMLKKAASLSRQELEEFFEIKVNLQCWVKVKEDWRNREGLIRSFGLTEI